MFKENLLTSIAKHWAAQELDDPQTRMAMYRNSSRDPLVQASMGLNIGGEPGFSASALSGQTEKNILCQLGAYLMRDKVEAGMLAYVASHRGSLARLAEAANQPEEWLLAAHGRVDRFNSEHPICNRRPQQALPIPATAAKP